PHQEQSAGAADLSAIELSKQGRDVDGGRYGTDKSPGSLLQDWIGDAEIVKTALIVIAQIRNVDCATPPGGEHAPGFLVRLRVMYRSIGRSNGRSRDISDRDLQQGGIELTHSP